VPLKVTVSHSWGFILVNGTDSVNGNTTYTLSLFNINGLPIKTIQFPEAVHHWHVWKSVSGFDFIVLATKRGKLFAFELFFMDIGRPVYRCGAELVCLDYSIVNNHIIAVTTEGKVHLIPFLARSVERYA
jgi:hypothetical protein